MNELKIYKDFMEAIFLVEDAKSIEILSEKIVEIEDEFDLFYTDTLALDLRTEYSDNKIITSDIIDSILLQYDDSDVMIDSDNITYYNSYKLQLIFDKIIEDSKDKEEAEIEKIRASVSKLLNTSYLGCEDDFSHKDIVSEIRSSITQRDVMLVPNYDDYSLVFKVKFSNDSQHFFYNLTYSDIDNEENIIVEWV